MSNQLTYKQMATLRTLSVSEDRHLPSAKAKPLLRKGVITNGAILGRYFLTASGDAIVKKWVKDTGDGPEDLKAIFSRAFGGGL